MHVGLIGFGKTGRAVATILLESPTVHLDWVVRNSHFLEHRNAPEYLGLDSSDDGHIYSREAIDAETLLNQHPVDAIIDFSAPAGLDYYALAAAKRGVTVITAVSYYPEAMLAQLAELAQHTKVLHSPNITLGINFLLIAAKILKNIAPSADIEIIEEHFKVKSEISGTAKIIARTLDLPESSIKSLRAGGIIGVHEVLFGFPYQTVRLRHESIAREAFGNGIVFALENLVDKPIGMHTMESLLLPYFKPEEPPPAADKLPIRKAWWQFWK